MTAHEDYDAGENGGAMTDGDYYETIARGERESTAPGQSRVSVEPSEIDGDTVTEASITVERFGDTDPELADQMLLLTPAELRAVYDHLHLYYKQGIWSFGTVTR